MSNAPKVGEVTDDLSLLGRRDAFHVPGILVQSDFSVPAGTPVRFTDDTLTKVVPVYKEEFYTQSDEGVESEISLKAHAVTDPFKPYTSKKHLFWVFPIPGSTADLTHSFKVTLDVPSMTEKERELLSDAADEEESFNQCKGCYS